MKNKIYLLLSIFVLTIFFPANAFASSSYHPIFEQGGGSFMRSFEKAAVVGKIIEWNTENQSYIVYGRLSADAGTGYKVYHSGMFFVAETSNTIAKEEIERLISEGKGVKLFGRYVSSFDTDPVMYFSKVEEYKPELDAGVGLKPAYSATEPIDWVGFGIHRYVNNSKLTSFDSTKDFVNSLYPFTQSLKANVGANREIIEKEGQYYLTDSDSSSFLYTPKDIRQVLKADVYRDETPKVVPRLGNKRTDDHRLYLNQIKSKNPLKDIYYLLSTSNLNSKSLNSVGGTVFVKTLKGQSNHYLKSIPVTRPDIDRFVTVLENKKSSGFSEWADNGLFYGKVEPVYITIEVAGKLKEVFSHVEFTGSYFPSKHIDSFLDTIEGYSKEVLEQTPYKYPDKDEKDKFRNKETWVIENMSEETALSLEKAGYAWLNAARYLTYRLPCHCGSEDCPGYYDVTVDYGNMKDDPEASLIERYMTYDKAITKAELNFTLSVFREMTI